jgi:hypothetical protein
MPSRHQRHWDFSNYPIFVAVEYSLRRFLRLFSRLRCPVLVLLQPQSTPSHFLTAENFSLLLLSERLIIATTPSRAETQIKYQQVALNA